MSHNVNTTPVRLSVNESPFGPLPQALQALADAGPELNRYPLTSEPLADAIANFYGLMPENVMPTAGSAEMLRMAIAAFIHPGQKEEVVYGSPSFAAYPLLVQLAGAVARPIPVQDGALDLPAMFDAITDQTKIILLCNPNNPTGIGLPFEKIADFIKSLPHDRLVIVDEAYAEFTTPEFVRSPKETLALGDNVLVTRTFSKAHGLAGLRVGYGLGSADLINKLRAICLPYHVNSAAQLAAIASLTKEAQSELNTRMQTAAKERARVITALRKMSFKLRDSEGNFVWLPLRKKTKAIAGNLAQHGILVLPVEDQGMRVSIGLPDQNDRFLDSVRAYASQEVMRA